MVASSPIVVYGVALVPSLVLATGGFEKLRNPEPVLPALATLRLPARRSAARAIGTVELGIAAGALLGVPLLDGRLGWVALAWWYAALTVVAWRLSRLGRSAPPCGCFGTTGAPMGPAHTTVNLVSTMLAALAAVVGAPGAAGMVRDAGAAISLAVCVYAALGSWLVITVMRDLPAWRPPAENRAGSVGW